MGTNSFQEKISDWLKKSLHKEFPVQTFKCNICGKIHSGLPMDLIYRKPAGYFKIPQDERAARIICNDDICVIDNREFYIRGVLPIPIINSSDEFHWGAWARVDQDDFKTNLEYWDGNIPENLPSLHGTLSGGPKDYPESDMIPVEIILQSGNQRPIFIVLPTDNLLYIDQQNGISMEKVHTFVQALL